MKDISTDPGCVEWRGVLYRTILSPGESGGAMSIVDSHSPQGSGPPRHVHEAEDETFVVLTGSCRVWTAARQAGLQPGEAFFIPRGTEHTFQVDDPAGCRHLVILTPGGFEGFFTEAAAAGLRIPEDMAALQGLAARFHLRFTGPPLDM